MEDYISLNFFANDASSSMSLRQDSSNAIVLPRLAISAFSLAISLLRLSIVSFALRSSFTRNSMFVICSSFWLLHYCYTMPFRKIQMALLFLQVCPLSVYAKLNSMSISFISWHIMPLTKTNFPNLPNNSVAKSYASLYGSLPLMCTTPPLSV